MSSPLHINQLCDPKIFLPGEYLELFPGGAKRPDDEDNRSLSSVDMTKNSCKFTNPPPLSFYGVILKQLDGFYCYIFYHHPLPYECHGSNPMYLQLNSMALVTNGGFVIFEDEREVTANW
jgi:hypothetical protein